MLDGELLSETSEYIFKSNINTIYISKNLILHILNNGVLWLLFYVCGLIWQFCNFILYCLMYSSFVFYLTANGRKIGRNM